MLLSETYLETQTHELLMTFLVAMAPVIELLGAIQSSDKGSRFIHLTAIS